MILLDTNVISETLKPAPDAKVTAWLNSPPMDEAYLSTLNLAELRVGIECLPEGNRKDCLCEALETRIIPAFEGRILSFDERSSIAWAQLQADSLAAGRPVPVMDSLIAAIARSRGAALATRNVKDFAHCGIQLINPWDDTPFSPTGTE